MPEGTFYHCRDDRAEIAVTLTIGSKIWDLNDRITKRPTSGESREELTEYFGLSLYNLIRLFMLSKDYSVLLASFIEYLMLTLGKPDLLIPTEDDTWPNIAPEDKAWLTDLLKGLRDELKGDESDG